MAERTPETVVHHEHLKEGEQQAERRAAADRKLHESILRHLKGIALAYEEWIKSRSK